METLSDNSSNPQKDKTPRSTWWQIVSWLGLIALLVILALGLNRSRKGPVRVGERAPDFVLESFDGETFDTTDYKGKVIVVNFWASWCKPCEQEAEDLENAWRFYKVSGEVIFLGVDYVDTETEALKYIEKFDITYPNGPDLRTSISQSYRISGVPETYIIGRDGIITHMRKGPFLNINQIFEAIDPLLD